MSSWEELLTQFSNNIIAQIKNDYANHNSENHSSETIRGLITTLTNKQITRVLNKLLQIIEKTDDSNLRNTIKTIITATIHHAQERRG